MNLDGRRSAPPSRPGPQKQRSSAVNARATRLRTRRPRRRDPTPTAVDGREEWRMKNAVDERRAVDHGGRTEADLTWFERVGPALRKPDRPHWMIVHIGTGTSNRKGLPPKPPFFREGIHRRGLDLLAGDTRECEPREACYPGSGVDAPPVAVAVHVLARVVPRDELAHALCLLLPRSPRQVLPASSSPPRSAVSNASALTRSSSATVRVDLRRTGPA